MHALVKTAFMRLYALDCKEEERKLTDTIGDQDTPEAKMTVTTDSQTNIAAETSGETAVADDISADEIPALSEATLQPEADIKTETELPNTTIRQPCKPKTR